MTLNPGLYLGLPEDDYHSDPAISYSNMKSLLVSPGEYWASSVHNPNRAEKQETDPMAIGKKYHCLLLEPDEFYKRYRVTPGDEWKAGDTRQICARSEYQQMLAAREAVRALPEGDQLLNLKYGYPEVTVVWDDVETGVRCRSRQDFFCWEWSVDYKTIESIEEGKIKYSFNRYRYDIQHAHYHEGRKQVREMLKAGTAHYYGDFSDEFIDKFEGQSEDFFIFLFQKKKEPYTAVPLHLCDDSIRIGGEARSKALKIYCENVQEHGLKTPWPQVRKGVQEFSIYYGFLGGA